MATIRFPSDFATDIGCGDENQDCAFVDAATRQLAVFDGHGVHGGLRAAEIACDVFRAHPYAHPLEVFPTAELAIFDAISTLPTGGTTATLVRFNPDGSMMIANVGDSDVVCFDGPSDAGTCLTANHSCLNLQEWLRVQRDAPQSKFMFTNSAFTSAERPVWIMHNGEWILHPSGTFEYCDVRQTSSTAIMYAEKEGNRRQALAMTRSLGDFKFKPYGVSAVPDFITHPAPAVERVVIVASDGLWDALTYAEARAVVYRPDLVGNADAATNALLQFGLARARYWFKANCDNITCAVVYVTADDEYEAAVEAAIEAAADTATDTLLAADAWIADVEAFIEDAVTAFETEPDLAFETE